MIKRWDVAGAEAGHEQNRRALIHAVYFFQNHAAHVGVALVTDEQLILEGAKLVVAREGEAARGVAKLAVGKHAGGRHIFLNPLAFLRDAAVAIGCDRRLRAHVFFHKRQIPPFITGGMALK